MPSGITELAGAHDLGADTRIVLAHKGVVNAAAPARLADHLVPPAGNEHPLVEPFAGMAHW
jgi:hypothetical protein